MTEKDTSERKTERRRNLYLDGHLLLEAVTAVITQEGRRGRQRQGKIRQKEREREGGTCIWTAIYYLKQWQAVSTQERRRGRERQRKISQKERERGGGTYIWTAAYWT